jgi:hypothetical protein
MYLVPWTYRTIKGGHGFSGELIFKGADENGRPERDWEGMRTGESQSYKGKTDHVISEVIGPADLSVKSAFADLSFKTNSHSQA